MTRVMDPLLREGLQRANPVVRNVVEITAPDSQLILRRADDQFLSTPPRVTETPAASTAADATGAMILKPTSTEIANHYVTGSEYTIGIADISTQVAGLAWTIDPTYGRVVLRKFTAKIGRASARASDFELRIFRPKLQREFLTNPNGTYAGERGDFTFLEIVAPPIVAQVGAWVANVADVVFDLSLVRPEVGPGPIGNISADPILNQIAIAQNPYLIFQVNPIAPPTNSLFRWKTDTTTAITQAGIGTFQHVSFTRTKPELPWQAPVLQAWSECFKLEIETYPATSQEVYVLNLPTVPVAASTGRVVFERSLPQGTAATLELSTAGSGGPWTPVKHGDVVGIKQAQYHFRATLNASAALRQTPRLVALGLDFRIPIDLSAEATVEPIGHEIQVPYCLAGIGEGRVNIVRTGQRDYLDPATVIATTYPLSKLEFDHYLGSAHPKITRDRWFLLERGSVTNREPGLSSESLPVLSLLKALKKQIPRREETINTVHTVQAGTNTAQVNVLPALTNAGAPGLYAGKGYYMRVRSSSQVGVGSGFIQTIDSNTDSDTLAFTTALPGTLIAGDIIEVHSAQFAAPTVQWADADPADVWLDLLINYGEIPLERIGYAGAGQVSRSGMPPKVSDRAPGDAITQAKLKVTLLLKGEEDLDKLIAQISFIMGGTTICIAGQIVFRQIYPLYDAAGKVSVPLARPEVGFDERDYAQLQTPTGAEDRSVVCACNYGVNSTVEDTEQATFTVQYVDADALAWLAEQDIADLGSRTIPTEISRWLYNTADSGFFLATQLTKQLVRVASTGLRVWTWLSVDPHPELHIGDAVWIVTDQYTDYDPARKMPIKGRWAFPLTIIGVAGGGRRFRGLLPGLSAALQVQGGAGTLPSDPTADASALALNNFRVTNETDTELTYSWDPGSLVSEVWFGEQLLHVPFATNPWDRVVLRMAPLAAGTTSVTVAKPVENFVRLIQLEPRAANLTPGRVQRLVINAAPTQPPIVELDDVETTTTGTQWWKITERGVAVTAVRVQTQVGTQPISAFVAPTRGPGGVSVVRGGLLGPGEYEHDVPLDASRLSWIMPRLTLGNGAAPIVLGPFAFDRDKRPNLVSVQLNGTVLTVIADSDSRSIKIFDKTGTWVYQFDGTNGTVDVSKTGTNGVAGLGSAATSTFTVQAQSSPLADVGVSTLIDARDITISGPTAGAPGALWDTPGVSASAPAMGSDIATVTLKATAAPAGYNVKLYISVIEGGSTPTVDHTADVAPALSAPPTVSTAYAYDTNVTRTSDAGEGSTLITMTVRADLRDAGNVVVDTRTVSASWYYGGTIPA